MSYEPYSRAIGDYEIRIGPDGRITFIGPDQVLHDLAETLKEEHVRRIHDRTEHD